MTNLSRRTYLQLVIELLQVVKNNEEDDVTWDRIQHLLETFGPTPTLSPTEQAWLERTELPPEREPDPPF